MAKADRDILDAAVASDKLVGRSSANQKLGANDFNGWVEGLIARLQFASVLDVCCGTGNQLVIFANRPGLNRLVGVDLSTDALKTALSRLQGAASAAEIILEPVALEDAFRLPTIRDSSFDLISCCYGLYYSRNVAKTLDEMLHHVQMGGHLLVIGPYGSNNAALFRLLGKHFRLPDLVVRSSSSFMDAEVRPRLLRAAEVQVSTFVNPIRYPNVDAVMDYWRKTTFYRPQLEAAVREDLEAHFAKHDSFVNEKHVMALVAQKS